MSDKVADSGGIPFQGRHLTSTGFDNDTGEADAQLLDALEARDERRWMTALRDARLLVPIVAAPGDVDTSGELAVEKSTDMAIVTITAPDGTKGLPVFTSLEALASWDGSARPSPVRAAFAAQAAIAEGCQVLLLDMASHHRVIVRSSMVWALAQGHEWVPAHEDEHVQRAVDLAIARVPQIRSVRLEDGGEGTLTLVVGLVSGLSQDELTRVATELGELLAHDGETRARIDSLAFRFTSAAL